MYTQPIIKSREKIFQVLGLNLLLSKQRGIPFRDSLIRKYQLV